MSPPAQHLWLVGVAASAAPESDVGIDIAGEGVADVRPIRDEIRGRIAELMAELEVPPVRT